MSAYPSYGSSLPVEEMTVDLGKSGIAQEAALEQNPALSEISDSNLKALTQHLSSRLSKGRNALQPRIDRYKQIDRLISTWQQLNKDDSAREMKEDNTGRQYAIPFNIPVLASYLTDMASYFAEALAPISNPFSTSSGDAALGDLTKRLSEDALARDYYGELVLTIRSLLKYNLGGMWVEWDSAGEEALGISGVNHAGNSWRSLDMYNTIWDPRIQSPREVSFRAEYAGTIRLTTRFEMIKKAARGEWVNLDSLLKETTRKPLDSRVSAGNMQLYTDPASLLPGDRGRDSHSGQEDHEQMTEEKYQLLGLGTTHDMHADDAPYELSTLYCWILPERFKLIPESGRAQLDSAGIDPKLFLQLWRFEIIDGATIVSARPVHQPNLNVNPHIPMYLAFMTRDQLLDAQRSSMELMRGFQRFTSAMHSIFVEGMRSNIWGLKLYDPEMFDMSSLDKGETAANIPSKVPGRDVRSGFMGATNDAGVQEAMQGVQASMNLRDQLFPSQALPSQISGMDRAVTSQVTSVVQGAQRPLRMLLRLMDSSLMMPTRMAAVRNIQSFDSTVAGQFDELTDEHVAKALGSGIETMEAERISEMMWRLLTGISQNQAAMERYDLPKMFAYLGNIMNLSVNMGEFVKPEPQQPQQGAPGAPGTEGAPTQPPPQPPQE